MKNTKGLIFGIIISLLLVVSMITMFMPYVKITESDVKHAVKAVFEDYEDIVGEIADDSEDEWLGSRTGVGIIDELTGDDFDVDVKQIKHIKAFVMVCLIVAWALALVTLILTWILKKRPRYICTLVISVMSALTMLCLFIFLPNVIKNKLVDALEDQMSIEIDEIEEEIEIETDEDFDLDEAFEIIGGESLRDTVIAWIGEFTRELLNNTLTYGYWLFIALMSSVAIVSIFGIIFDKKEFVAKIYVLSGAYKGACIDVDSNIVVGRDPNVCQLIMDGEQISRKHCKISFNNKTGKYLVTDYSTNGTYYTNGNRLDENVTSEIDSGTILILGKNGDKLKLG